MRRDYMHDALKRVIDNNGMVQAPSRFTGAMVSSAWYRAYDKGYLRIVQDDEVAKWLQTRRGVRTVLLALMEQTATNEGLDPNSIYDDVTVSAISDAISEVVCDIHNGLDESNTFYTLTPRGVKELEGYEKGGAA